MHRRRVVSLLEVVSFIFVVVDWPWPTTTAFLLPSRTTQHRHHNHWYITQQQSAGSSCHHTLTKRWMAVPRYGPIEDNNEQHLPLSKNKIGINNNIQEEIKSEFTTLLHKVINVTTTEEGEGEEELPSLFTQNIEMILTVISTDGLLEEIINEDVQQHQQQHNLDLNNEEVEASDSSSRLDDISNAVNIILSFIETFVEQTKSMDDIYKQLLGKIFTSIAPGGENDPNNNNNNVGKSSSSSLSMMENELDTLLSTESNAFTPGFLRHVEGECNRISSQRTISPESTRMLQILRLIQTRILEELGKVCCICNLLFGLCCIYI